MPENDLIDIQMLFLKKQFYKMANDKNFENGEVFIQDSFYRFVSRELFGGKLHLMVPEEFINMPMHIASKRYFSADKPDVILTSKKYTETITFKISPLGSEQIHCIAIKVQNALRHLFPQNVFYDEGIILEKCLEIHWLEYKSFGMANEVYNILFLFALGEELVTGCFQCEFRDYDEWKQCAFLMIQSISIANFAANKQEVST